jgi:4-hydroxy-2-oxoheptanedioate aldolase
MNQLKEKVLAGKKLMGSFHEIGSTVAAGLMGHTGLDYTIIDCEHGPFEAETAQALAQAAAAKGVAPFARVKEISRPAILKLLDAGAQGLIIPNVKTLEQAREIVRFGKFQPVGERGVAATVSSDFWFSDMLSEGIEGYFQQANELTMLIPQCETVECLENIEQIAALDGIDGIFVGPYDLSTAMGKPAQFEDPEIRAAIARILAACKAAGKLSFIYTGDLSKAREYLAMGFDSVTYSLDAIVLVEAYREAVRKILAEE